MSRLTVFARKFLPEAIIPSLRTVKYHILGFVYSGNNFYCPICSGKFRTFLPSGDLTMGEVIHHNTRCPRCGSEPRQRVLWLYLKNKTDFFSGKNKVLHFAPEHCFHNRLRRMNNLDYVSVDMEPKKAMMVMDITNIRFKDNTFDYIFCLHVLEHVQDDIKAMSELYRVLKPKGKTIIMVPIVGERTLEDRNIVTTQGRLQHYGQIDHVRLYGTDIKERLENVGFSVNPVSYVDELDLKSRAHMHLLVDDSWYDTKEDIYVSVKIN